MDRQFALGFLWIHAADDRMIVGPQPFDHVRMEAGVSIDPERLFASRGQRVARHLAAAEVDLLVSIRSPYSISSSLQLAQRRLARRLDSLGDRNQDGALARRTRLEWHRGGRSDGRSDGGMARASLYLCLPLFLHLSFPLSLFDSQFLVPDH